MTRTGSRDGRILLLSAAGLLATGILAVHSASSFAAMRAFGDSSHYLVGHLTRILAGLAAGAAAWRAGPAVWRRVALPLYAFSLVSLAASVALSGSPLAPVVNGSSRWIAAGPLRFMPSEMCRFSLVLLCADLVSSGAVRPRRLSGVAVLAALALVPAAFAMLQPDFAGAAFIVFLMFAILFIAEARIGHILALAAGVAVLLGIFVLSAPYRLERVTGWANPETGVREENFQPQQSCIALGSGGLGGRGLGHGRQQRGFLPEAFSDFILAVIGEETGFVGTGAVLLMFCSLLCAGWRIADRADNVFGTMLAGGVTATLAMGSLIHIAVATRLAPTTGMTLPLVSWGGTSILFTMVSIAMAARISEERRT